MNCPRCQSLNDPSANYCNQCGTLLRDLNGGPAYNPFLYPQTTQPDRSAFFLMLVLGWEMLLAILQAGGLQFFIRVGTPTAANINLFYKVFNVSSLLLTSALLIVLAVMSDKQRTRVFLLVYLVFHLLVSGYYTLTTFSSHF